MISRIICGNRSYLVQDMLHTPFGAPMSLGRQREPSRRSDRVVGSGSGGRTTPPGATEPWAVMVTGIPWGRLVACQAKGQEGAARTQTIAN